MDEYEIEELERKAGIDRLHLLKVGGVGALALAGLGSIGAGSAFARTTRSEGMLDFSGLKGKTVGISGVAVTSEAPARSANYAKKLGAANGFKVQVVDTAGDYKKMSDTLKTWAQSKTVQAVISDVVSPSLIKEGMAECAKANIPVAGIFAGWEPGLAIDVASNDWVSSAKIATYIVDRLGGQGNVAILNWPNVPALQIRGAAIKAHLGFYKGIKIVSEQVLTVPGQVPDAKAKTKALLTKYPKGKLHCIVGGWDEVGVAAGQACKESGRGDVFVVGIDGNLASFDSIRAGNPFAATCANDMEAIAATALSQLSNILKGGKPSTNTIWVDAPFVAKQNVPASGKFPKGLGETAYYVK